MNKKQSLGKAFINLLKYLPNPSELHQEECNILKNSHTDLADIIYETNKTNGKQIPLFACKFEPADTGAGKFINVRIIEAQLNFSKYSQLLSAIFKTNIALQIKNFNTVAQLFELYTQDKNDPKKFVILNDNLDNTPSSIKTFIRRNEKIGPSETIVED